MKYHSAYVIYVKDFTHTEAEALRCVDTGKKHGIDISMYDGYTPRAAEDFFLEEGVQFPNKARISYSKIHRPGVRGCLASHWSLWKRCIELNEPILIFEHDQVIIRPLPNMEYDEYIHLNRWVFENNVFDEEPIVGDLEYNFKGHDVVPGCFAYIITPQACKKVIAGIKKNGLLPADQAISKAVGIHRQYLQPPITKFSEMGKNTSLTQFLKLE